MTNVQIILLGEQAQKDHVAWLKAASPHLTGLQLVANSAGFAAGWREAIRTLKAQGAIKPTN